MKLNSGHHCVHSIQYHLVFVTKYRRKCITPGILEYLKEVFHNLSEKWKVELKEFSGEEDHVHLLITAYPHIQLSKFVNNLKTVSSRLVRKKYAGYLRRFYWKPYFWTRSYCLISTGGATIEVIKRYILSQGLEKNSGNPCIV